MTQLNEQLQLGPAGTVFFDGTCGLCTLSARRLHNQIGPHGFTMIPLQTPGVPELLQVKAEELDLEIKLRTPAGKVLGGADALIHLTRWIWWAYPIWLIAHVPGVTPLFRFVYRIVARNRRNISGACKLDRHALFICPNISVRTEITDKTPRGILAARSLAIAAIPFTLALFLGHALPAWAWMWAMTLTLWFGFKWLMWNETAARHPQAPAVSALLYFIAWPSMDARPFFHPAAQPVTAPPAEWLRGGLMTLVGMLFIWFIPRTLMPNHDFLAGWSGMIGAALVLHFGLFHLIAVAWRANGVDVQALMNKPTHATSVADFWTRWNLGFHDIAFRLVFRPLLRRLGLAGAMLATFFFSGIVHDVVITLPARGGYGLPTAYFMIQGIVVLFEKSRLGRRMYPLARRLLTYVTVLAPVGLLFPPVFVRNVFVPFLAAIHAI